MNDKYNHDDTPTGQTPDVWICQNPECGDKLIADTIGRDGPGEDAELFCTSCSSRDVRLATEYINMQQVPIRTEAGHKIRAAFKDSGPQPVLFRCDWSI